jgi:hypothetical protein
MRFPQLPIVQILLFITATIFVQLGINNRYLVQQADSSGFVSAIIASNPIWHSIPFSYGNRTWNYSYYVSSNGNESCSRLINESTRYLSFGEFHAYWISIPLRALNEVFGSSLMLVFITYSLSIVISLFAIYRYLSKSGIRTNIFANDNWAVVL